MKNSKRFPNGPPKTYKAEVELNMTLGVITADHHHHALELVEELIEVMAQNAPYVMDAEIAYAEIQKTEDIVIDD